jgi:hypothetical protein
LISRLDEAAEVAAPEADADAAAEDRTRHEATVKRLAA